MAKEKEAKINLKYNLKEYFSFVKKYKLVFISMAFISLILEAGHMADKFLFKIIIDNGTNFAGGILLKNAFVQILLIVALIYAGVIVVNAVFEWFNIHLMNRMTSNMTFDLKKKYFNHILNLSHGFHTSHKSGSLISKLTRSGGAVDRLNDAIVFNFFPLIFQTIVISVSLAYFSLSAVYVILATIVVFLTYSFSLQGKMQKLNIFANNIEDKEKGNISDFFTNIDSIKYFGKEKKISGIFEKLAGNTKNAFIRAWDFYRWMDSGQRFILAIGTFFLIYFPLIGFLNGTVSLGTLVFIYTSYSNIFWPLYAFVHGIRSFYRSMADFDALFEYGKIENEIKDKENAKDLEIKQGNIEFKNVWFGYEKRIIFQGLNLKIPKNKKIALVGHSGCGKTTLVKLLYRLYDVSSGSILIDEKDIREFKQESLRSEMSIVPQEAVLFDDTIYNNVKFSKPDASREEVLKAIKFAQLNKIIQNFPKKENTIVGERGVRLSGGEKQRVSIARAILADKKILVLDEATSSLDSETEAEIQKDLIKLMGGRTSIVIAHRLSTIMSADVIVVMKNGKIVQLGKHNQLIRQEGEYGRLWKLQRGGYIK